MALSQQEAREIVLKHLYNSHNDAFNTDDTPVSFRLLAQDTGFDESTIAKIVRYLEEKGLLEVIRAGNPFARITAAGIDQVEESISTERKQSGRVAATSSSRPVRR